VSEAEPVGTGQRATAVVSWSHASNAGTGAAPGTAVRDSADKAWERQVYDLVTTLRAKGGIDVTVDLASESDPSDWTRLGPTLIRERDVTLVVVNAAWRRAWEGGGPADVGAGAAAEADELHGLFNRDQEAFQRKVKLVVLPGVGQADLPPGLDRLPRYTVATFDATGIKPLVRALTGQPRLPLVELGPVPVLPPETAEVIDRDVPKDPAARSEPGTPPETLKTASPSSAEPVTRAAPLAAEIAFLESALGQLPAPGITDGPHLPWYREWERMLGQLQRLRSESEVAPDHDRAPSPGGAANRSEIDQRLSGLLDSMSGLVRTNRCWLTLAAVPGGIVEDRQAYRDGASNARARRITQVEDWKTRTFPLVAVETHGAVRAAKRVIFPGEPQPGISSAYRSTLRRVELHDDGSGVAGVDVADAPRLVPDTSIVAFPGSPGESVVDSEAYLPVRRVRLEMGVLTLLELLVDYIRCTGGDPLGPVSVLARLELPDRLEVKRTHNLKSRGVRFIDEHRDLTGRSGGVESPVGSRELGPGEDWPVAGPLSRRLVVLLDPPHLVRAAQLLAAELLEYASVEQTVLLQSDGSIDPAAGSTTHDQQVIRRHADLVGLSIAGSAP